MTEHQCDTPTTPKSPTSDSSSEHSHSSSSASSVRDSPISFNLWSRSRSISPLDHERGRNVPLIADIKFHDEIVKLAEVGNNRLDGQIVECHLDVENRIVRIGSTNLLTDPEFLMDIALIASERSDDPKTKVGACIVDRRNRLVGIGYNHFPRNYTDEPYPWGKSKCNPLDDKRTYVVHAEADAIIGRMPADLRGGTIYSTLLPCNECAKLIIQSGICKVYYRNSKAFEKWIYQASRRMLEAARVTLQQLE